MSSYIYYAILILSYFNSNLHFRITFLVTQSIFTMIFLLTIVFASCTNKVLLLTSSVSQPFFFPIKICQAMFTYDCICIPAPIEGLLLTYLVTQSNFSQWYVEHVYYAISYFSSNLHLRTNRRIITNVFSDSTQIHNDMCPYNCICIPIPTKNYC